MYGGILPHKEGGNSEGSGKDIDGDCKKNTAGSNEIVERV